jgi:hypothetical protein
MGAAMNRGWWSDHWIEATIVVVVLAVVMLILVLASESARAESACLKLGYPQMKMDGSGNAYCIKRVNNTDIVVPLAEAQR